jgi:hypothetical protein
MIRNKFNFLKWFVFRAVLLILFLGLTFGQTDMVGAGESAPVTVYKKVDQYSLITWNTLSHFDCGDPDEYDEDGRLIPQKKKAKCAVPGFITALNGAPVAVVGFMLPMDMDDKGDKTTGFIICRTQSACCYGIMPRLNEWIYVKMAKGKATDVYMDIPVTAFGTLSAGEVNDKENGDSFYRMTGDKVGYPKEIW